MAKRISETQSTTAIKMEVITMPILNDPTLALAADIVDDTERVRIANENRLRQLTRPADQPDADGICRGFGLDETHPDVARLKAMVEMLLRIEKDATKYLEDSMKKHPLGPWVIAAKGIGLKQGGRLIAKIGDPYWHNVDNRPRLVSELWAYCGFHVWDIKLDQPTDGTQPPIVGVAPKRMKGKQSNWSEDARKRSFLVATSIVKAGGPYRAIYDETKEHYAEAVHKIACKQCGPKGKPALAGSPLSKAHTHARGLRAISKSVLKDLWIEAKRIHEESN